MSLVGKQIGNYQITKLIGSGGMGSVYLGEHPLIGRRVAVKVLHPEMAESADMVTRFFNEAKAANDIREPHIVDVIDLGRTEDNGLPVVYLVMEFLDGESLKHRMKRPLSDVEIALIVDQIAAALGASHAKHIVHRDLKPDNVYIIAKGDDPLFVKVLDFGIAKLLDAPKGASVTRSGTVLGTPEYMSPEQCDGSGRIDHRTDIYALGVMLYEMLTGRLPFQGALPAVIMGHRGGLVPPITGLNPNADPRLAAITMRCLDKDRDRRFQSMDELRVELAQSGLLPRGRATAILAAPVRRTPPPETMSAPATAEVVATAPTQLGGEVQRISEELRNVAGERITKARKKTAAIAGGVSAGAVLLAAGILVAVGVTRHRSDTDVAPTPAATTVALPDKPGGPVIPPVHKKLQVVIKSQPAGAQVIRAGYIDPIGETPLTIDLEPNGPSFDVMISLAGHKPVTLTVTGDRAETLSAVLAEIPAPPIAPPPTTPSPTASPQLKATTPTTSPKDTTPPRAVTKAAAKQDEPVEKTTSPKKKATTKKPSKDKFDPDKLLAPEL